MKLEFPYKHYESIAPAVIPDENLMGVYAPLSVGQIDEERIISLGI